MDANANVAEAFNKLFQPVSQFPRWFQPHPEIGQILVHSQEEEDELRACDWTPKPLPGSENPVAKVNSIEDVSDAMEYLQEQRDLHAQQMATDRAELDAKMARLEAMMTAVQSGTPVPPGAPSPTPEHNPGADMPGGLSDASDDEHEDTK